MASSFFNESESLCGGGGWWYEVKNQDNPSEASAISSVFEICSDLFPVHEEVEEVLLGNHVVTLPLNSN